MLTIKGYGFYETGTVDVTVDGINCPVQSITRDATNEKIHIIKCVTGSKGGVSTTGD